MTARRAAQGVNGSAHAHPNGTHPPGLNGDQADDGPVLTTRTAAQVKQAKTSWLWQGRLAYGYPSLLEGKKERGKSTLLATIAAAITGGPPLPGERKKKAADVLWIYGEEDAVTVRGKLLAAKANIKRVHFPELPGGGRPTIPADLRGLEQLAARLKCKLLILDPIQAVASPGVCLEVDEGANQFMQGCLDWAARTGCCVLGSRNMVKHTSGMDALAQGRGSGTLADRARSVLRLDRHPDIKGTYAVSVVACNLGSHASTLLYTIEATNTFPRIAWAGTSDLDAEQLSLDALDAGEQDCRQDARVLLCRSIGRGWKAAREILGEAEKAGIASRTLRRAKADLGVPSRRAGGYGAAGHYEWGPPPKGWPKELRG